MNELLTVRDAIQFIRDSQNAFSKLQQGKDDNGMVTVDESTANDIKAILLKFQEMLNNASVLFN